MDSNPSGAHVFINGKDRGLTPQTIRYAHEGRFEIRLEKQGYESLAEEFETTSHADAIPGPDIVLENLPGPTRRVTSRTFELAPLKRSSYSEAEMKAMLSKADAFRREAKASFVEPGTPQPTRPDAAGPTRAPGGAAVGGGHVVAPAPDALAPPANAGSSGR